MCTAGQRAARSAFLSVRLGVAVALLLGLVATSSRADAGEQGILGLLPENTALVITLNLERSQKGAAGKRLITALTRSDVMAKPLARLRSEAGLVLERDVKIITLAMASDFEQTQDMVVIAEGRFAQAKIVAVARAESKSFATQKHRGTTYYVLDDETALAFLGSRAVLTPKNTMTKVIDVFRRKASPAAKNKSLVTLIDGGDTKKDLWAAFLIPANLRGEIAKETGGHSVDAVMASADTKSGMALRARLEVSTDEGAQAIAVVLREAIAEAGKSPEVASLGIAAALSNSKITRTEKRLDVAFDLSAEELTKLIVGLESELTGSKQ